MKLNRLIYLGLTTILISGNTLIYSVAEPYGGDTSVLEESNSTGEEESEAEGDPSIGYGASQEQIDKANSLLEQKKLEKEQSKDNYKKQISFGADLNDEARKEVVGLLGISEDELKSYDILTIDHFEEVEKLSKYIPQSQLGKGAISCVELIPLPEGSGISIGTINIDYVTNLMYYNVLVTAGVKDVDVKVAAPTKSSGSCALVGMLKAYQNMTGEHISDKAIDVAMNEMSVIDTLSLNHGAEETSKLLDKLKGKVIENGSTDIKSIKNIIKGIATIQKITLTDDEVNMTAECMVKITELSNERKLYKMETSVKYIGTKDFKKAIDEFGGLLSNEIANFINCK